MPAYSMPTIEETRRPEPKEVLLVANGDLRLSANHIC